MKTSAPIIIGVIVFAAILVGWVYTLPRVLGHTGAKTDGILTEISSDGKKILNSIKDAQTIFDDGVKEMNAAIVAGYGKEATINNLKSKIETKQKIKAALLNASGAKQPLNEPAKP